jgi:hypothetical protein
MINIVLTTDQEKFKMYNKLSKKELIQMLIQANRHLYRLTPKIDDSVMCPKCGIHNCNGNPSGSVKCYCSNEIQ